MLVVPLGDIMFAGIEALVENLVDGVQVLARFCPYKAQVVECHPATLRKIDRLQWTKDAVFVNGTNGCHVCSLPGCCARCLTSPSCSLSESLQHSAVFGQIRATRIALDVNKGIDLNYRIVLPLVAGPRRIILSAHKFSKVNIESMPATFGTFQHDSSRPQIEAQLNRADAKHQKRNGGRQPTS